MRKRCRFPVRLPKKGPRTHAEQIFEELKATCKPTPSRERAENSWIQPDTWQLIDARAALRKEDKLAQRALRNHNRRVTAALKHDQKKWAADVGDAMMEKLVGGEMQEACYWNAEDMAPKPCYDTMAKKMPEWLSCMPRCRLREHQYQ